MFITDEKHHNTQFLANLSCDEKLICIPLPNKICNSACMFYTMIVNYVYIHNMYVYEIVRDSKIVQRYNVLCIVPFVHQIFNILSKDSFDKKFLCFLT